MRTVPLTVLAAEGPIARAYLARLRLAGLRPARILLLVQARHAIRKTPLAKWLPPGLRRRWAEHHQKAAWSHWPRRLAREHPTLVERLVDALAPVAPTAPAVVTEMLGWHPWERYAPSVDRLLVDGLRDPRLLAHLRFRGAGAVLFTGGGIVPRSLLDLPRTRLLHVHPGHLPHVRGADGLLWSLLVRGRPGASLFYLAAGIDTGPIIATRESPPIECALPASERLDDASLYRAVFAFCDPVLRAEILASALQSASAPLEALDATPQDLDVGTTYHFMHPRLRAAALEKLFPARPAARTGGLRRAS